MKTSILILDKALARQSDSIGFFKVENDGYGLGAQRRAVEGEQLTQVKAEVAIFLQAIRSGLFRAKGPASSQPGAPPQDSNAQNIQGLKARPNRASADGAGLQPSMNFTDPEPGAMPQAGMERAVGAETTATDDLAAFRAKGPTYTSPGQSPGFIAIPDDEGLKARPILEMGLMVPKEKIAANGDYNLSGERYREGAANVGLTWPLVPIGDLCVIERGASPRPIQDFMTDAPDGVNWIKIGDAEVGAKYITTTKERVTPAGAAKSRRVKPGDFLLSNSMSFGRPYVMATDGCIHDGWLLLRDQSDQLDQDYLYNILGSKLVYAQFKQAATGGVVNNLNSQIVRGVKIPLPPLAVQQEIVAEIEGYQKVINGARAVLDHYRPHIPIHPDWPVAELGDVCSFASGGTPSKANDAYWAGTIPWVSAKDLKMDEIYDAIMHVSDAAITESATQIAPIGSLLILVRGMGLANGVPIGEVMEPCAFNQDLKALLSNTAIVTPRFLAFALRQQVLQFSKILETASHGTLKINSDDLRQIEIPLPPLAAQRAIVAEIEAEQALVSANRELITRFEQKIQTTLARVWGEEKEESLAQSRQGAKF